jgi:hypothetical protein
LGDDADQFTTGNDGAAFVEDGDDDLLGGGGGEEVTEFESSFPAIDDRNEVHSAPNLRSPRKLLTNRTERSTRWNNHGSPSISILLLRPRRR